MDVFQLIYSSRRAAGTTAQTLHAIAQAAQRRNEERGITGIMLIEGDTILQVIEGTETAVRELYAAIAADARHEAPTILLTCQADERAFARWHMGVCEVESDDADLFRLALSTVRARKRQKESPRRAA